MSRVHETGRQTLGQGAFVEAGVDAGEREAPVLEGRRDSGRIRWAAHVGHGDLRPVVAVQGVLHVGACVVVHVRVIEVPRREPLAVLGDVGVDGGPDRDELLGRLLASPADEHDDDDRAPEEHDQKDDHGTAAAAGRVGGCRGAEALGRQGDELGQHGEGAVVALRPERLCGQVRHGS